ncbi:MAG: DUF882 domain-containing protein [Elusimicrobiota bacterium]
MNTAAFSVFILLLFCHCLPAQSGDYAAPGAEISASALMERLPAMLDDVPAPPEVTEAEVVDLEEGDPETYIFIHGAGARPPEPVNLGGDGILSLTRQGSGEQLIVRYRSRKGVYNKSGIDKISRIMRCSLTGNETAVSVKLLEIMDAVEDRFGKRGLTILSGYRTPKLNSRVSGAARRSLHMLGWAADVRIAGYSPARVAAYARGMRTGGVGYYPDIGFAHLDAGYPKYWVVRRSRSARAAGVTAR